MKVEIRKVNVTKTILEQIPYLKPGETLTIHKVHGWCNMQHGHANAKKHFKVIVFETEPNVLKKMKIFNSIEVNEFKESHLLKPPTSYFIVTFTYNVFSPFSIRFNDNATATEYVNYLQQIKRLANQAGQFYY